MTAVPTAASRHAASAAAAHRPQPWLASLSPSRLSLYDQCPARFGRRYVLRLPESPSVELQFGIAVHAGIEAGYRDQDGGSAFLAAWRSAQTALLSAGLLAHPGLALRGVELVEAALHLGLSGEPERWISVQAANLPAPLLGRVDLWDSPGGMVCDFKTAIRPWGPAQSARQSYQPVVYSQAFAEAHDGRSPRFVFVVLPKTGPPVPQLLDATPTVRQTLETFERIRAIYRRIEALDFACTCRQCPPEEEPIIMQPAIAFEDPA